MQANNIFVYTLLLMLIMAADTTWLFPFIVSNVLFLIPMFFIGWGEHKNNIVRNKVWTYPYIIFITYLFLVNLLRTEHEFYVLVYEYIMQIFVVLSVLYLRKRPKYLTWFIVVYAILNIFFQFIQIGGTRATGGSFLEPLGFIEYAEVDLFDSTRGFRYSGLYTNVVELAYFSGIIIAYFWILYNRTKKITHLIMSIVGLVIAGLTNTRAVVYFIIPTIIFTDFITMKRLNTKLLGLCLAFAATFLIVQTYIGYSSNDSSMGIEKWKEDTGVLNRIQANIYGTIGTLEMNPLFGVPEDKQAVAINKGFMSIGLVYGDSFVDNVTYHNLPLYYLRIYGIVGFSLFVFLFFSLIRYTLKQKSNMDKQFMLTAILFFFLYNLSHNMKITYLIFFISFSANYEYFRIKKIITS